MGASEKSVPGVTGTQGTGSDATDSFLVGVESNLDPVLSVVMPTMNEEEGIGTCLDWVMEAIKELQVPAEIIVSDSSTDRTPAIATDRGAIVVEPDEPGYGYAYRYAFERARGDYIAMGDADATYDFSEIPRFLEHLRETDADIIMGSRLNGEIEPGSMPALHQYVGNPLLTRFLNTFYNAGVSDAHSGFRLFTADAVEELDLETDGMEFASEMIMKASAADLVIEEVPITYHEREGEETLDSFRDGWRHVRFMLVNAPGYLFSAPGAVLGGLGLVVMALVLTGIRINSITFGPNSMIAGSLLVMVGHQITCLGVFSIVVGDPIKKPNHEFIKRVRNNLTLERGATLGLLIFVLGSGYAVWLIWSWLQSGFAAAPFTIQSIAAFTGIVLGIQTIFSAFFLSMVDA